jgi:hypothetical protein
MKRQVLGVAALIGAGTLAYGVRAARIGTPSAAPTVAATPAPELPAAPQLLFSEFFQPGGELKLTAKLQSLNGQRVHIVGYMAQMEIPPPGGFFLVPRPVRCDEAGGGTADLPLESVLVLSVAAAGQKVPFLPGQLDVSGVLEVGNLAGVDGRVSAFRLRLDPGKADPDTRQPS